MVDTNTAVRAPSTTNTRAACKAEVETLARIGDKWTVMVVGAPVQIADPVETPLINMDTLSIENDSIPDGGRSGVPEPESGEVELALANAMHQLDA